MAGLRLLIRSRAENEAWGREQDALVIFCAVLASFDVEVVDDVGVGDQSEVELIGGGCRANLLSPESLGEQACEGYGAEGGELSAIHVVLLPGLS
jgi:hypothetical protein